MNVALVIVGDGRYAYLEQAIDSLREFVAPGTFSYWRVVDDSGRPSPLAFEHDWDMVRHERRRGLAAAVRSAWAGLPADIDFVLHFEEDFVLREELEVDRMAKTLDAHPELAQLVLKRQPVNAEETMAGGIIEAHPQDYMDRGGYVEHRRIFSLNPCLIPRAVVDRGWPDSNEAGFTQALLADGYRFGFWGARHDPPRALHIGAERSPGWKP